MADALSNLIAILTVRKAADGRWCASSEPTSWGRIYGGQVVAQAIAAAYQAVSDRTLHAIHANFMRPGNSARPVEISIENSFTGRSIATRHTTVWQSNKPIFTLAASFQSAMDGYAHQDEMPDVPPPEDLLSEAEMAAEFAEGTAMPVRHYWTTKAPFERRMVWLDRYRVGGAQSPVNAMWVRARHQVPAERWLHDALLGYISDMTLLETSLFPHQQSVVSPDIRAASLDHALWIHHPPQMDDWLLFHQHSPFAGNGRGLTLGSFYRRDGCRVATVAQEGMIRPTHTKRSSPNI